jgi:hypothetical protein
LYTRTVEFEGQIASRSHKLKHICAFLSIFTTRKKCEWVGRFFRSLYKKKFETTLYTQYQWVWMILKMLSSKKLKERDHMEVIKMDGRIYSVV